MNLSDKMRQRFASKTIMPILIASMAFGTYGRSGPSVRALADTGTRPSFALDMPLCDNQKTNAVDFSNSKTPQSQGRSAPSRMVRLTSRNIDSVLNEKGFVVVDISYEGCGPCKKLAPIIEALSVEFDVKAKFCNLEAGGYENGKWFYYKGMVKLLKEHWSGTPPYGASFPIIVVFHDGKFVKCWCGLGEIGITADEVKKNLERLMKEK